MTEETNAPPQPPVESSTGSDVKANQWAMFIHLSLFAGFVVPGAGLVLPIVLWQLKKDEMPGVDAHGKIVVNWIISMVIYGIVCFLLTFVVIGLLGFVILGIMGIVFPIMGGIKANNGEIWEYPLSLKLVK